MYRKYNGYDYVCIQYMYSSVFAFSVLPSFSSPSFPFTFTSNGYTDVCTINLHEFVYIVLDWHTHHCTCTRIFNIFSFLEFDCLFLSNGPGNSQMCFETITNLQTLL